MILPILKTIPEVICEINPLSPAEIGPNAPKIEKIIPKVIPNLELSTNCCIFVIKIKPDKKLNIPYKNQAIINITNLTSSLVNNMNRSGIKTMPIDCMNK